MQDFLNLAVAVIAFGLIALVLGLVVRFAVSSRRTRGAATRLRHPDPAGVAQVCGFAPPAELVELYRRAAFVERVEFELCDRTQQPPRIWEIGDFVPLTPRDVKEQRWISGVRDGIPIATDLDKGVYVVLRDGAVVLRSPNVPGREVRVAPSAAAFGAFEARAVQEDQDD